MLCRSAPTYPAHHRKLHSRCALPAVYPSLPCALTAGDTFVVVHSPSSPCPPPCSRLSPELRKEFVATIRSMAIGATLCGAMFALRWSLIVVAMVRTFRSSFKDKLLDVTLASNCGLSAVTYVSHPPAVSALGGCLRSVQTGK
jgi:hypothetical protein